MTTHPKVAELNLEGFSLEEKGSILAVLQREQDFLTKQGGSQMKLRPMEGQLSKFTNLMKGWQFRWFVLDPEKGTLAYYLDKEHVKGGPRGELSLVGGVISPSDEDSMSFVVHAANNEIYKLRASDAKERQHWINLIRAVAEYHTQSSPKLNSRPQRPPPPNTFQPTNLQRSATTSSMSTSPLLKLKLAKSKSVSQAAKGKSQNQMFVSAAPNPIKEELKNVKAALSSVEEYHSSAIEALESGPHTTDPGGSLDEKFLVLKATSQATVNILQQCYSILQQQAVEVQGCAAVSGVPAGAEIRWFEPSSDISGSKALARANSTDSTSSLDSAPEALQAVFTDVCQFELDEVEDVNAADEEAEEDMEGHKNVILHLLSQLKLGMDLTRVLLPTFVLEKRSLLEMYADFFGHPHKFTSIASAATPEDRMVAVLEFYLTSMHVGRKIGVAKKPYNPIIGETFHCSVDAEHAQSKRPPNGPNRAASPEATSRDRIYFSAEQVSHHPPISCFYAECPTKKICMNSHIWTKSKFFGMSIGVVNVGEGIIHLQDVDEDYVITFPNAFCRSILTFPWIELGGRTFIRCSKTGFVATIVFHTKPFYGGKKNRVTMEVKNQSSGSIVCSGEGYWDGVMELNFLNRTESKRVINVTVMPVTRKRVRPIHIQGDFESRKLWKEVTDRLRQGNLEAATECKHVLEEQQRKDEKLRLAEESEYKPKLFHKHGDSAWTFNLHMRSRHRSKSKLSHSN